MGARDRLVGAAGRALLRFTETKDAPTRRASGSNQYVFGGNPYSSTWDVERAVRDGMERVIWIARGIELNAQQVASWPVRAMQGDAPDWRQVEDPILPLFRSSRINPVDGSAYAFLVGLGMQFQLSKAGAFVEVIPNRAGGVAALYLLPPGQTKPIPDPDTFVSGFEVTHPGGEISRLKPYDPTKKSGVLWLKKRHPTNPYSSMTPLEAAGISIDLDFYARLYNRNFLLNDGRSGQLVAVKGGLSQEDAQELKARFSPGMGGAGRTTVIEADAITVQDTAMSPRDAQYAELRGITKEDLLLAVGIPESVFGNASGRTFDNADAEKEGWLDTTCKDLANWLGMGLDGLTAGGWDDDVHLWFDYSGEPVLQRTQRNRERDAADQVAAGLITVDEWRAVANLDAMGRPGSRVLWIPGGKAAVGDEEDETTAGELKPIGGGAPAPAAAGMTPQEMAATARGGAIAGAAQAQEVQESGALRESQNLNDDAGDEHKALPRVPKDDRCACCRGTGEHDTGRECYRCDASGRESETDGGDPVPCDGAFPASHATRGQKALPKQQKCKFCDEQAVARVIHSERMAYVPACAKHLDKAKDAAARCTPDGSVSPSNINTVLGMDGRTYKAEGKSEALSRVVVDAPISRVESYPSDYATQGKKTPTPPAWSSFSEAKALRERRVRDVSSLRIGDVVEQDDGSPVSVVQCGARTDGTIEILVKYAHGVRPMTRLPGETLSVLARVPGSPLAGSADRQPEPLATGNAEQGPVVDDGWFGLGG